MVMEGVSGVGAFISIRRPASVAATTVEFPKTAILVSFCSKSGKFLSNDSIPDGLKIPERRNRHFLNQRDR
jgi:hypothetical protein